LAKGRIIGLRQAGTRRHEIKKKVKKKDGKSPSLRCIDGVLERFEEDPEWDGCEDRTAGGRPRDLTEQQEARIRKILVRDVGKHVVTATYVKRLLKEIRLVPDRTVQRTFHRLGYAYLYRRGKAAIGDGYKPARLKYCDWLLKQDQKFLNTFAYVVSCFYTPLYRPWVPAHLIDFHIGFGFPDSPELMIPRLYRVCSPGDSRFARGSLREAIQSCRQPPKVFPSSYPLTPSLSSWRWTHPPISI
jgi:transposase